MRPMLVAGAAVFALLGTVAPSLSAGALRGTVPRGHAVPVGGGTGSATVTPSSVFAPTPTTLRFTYAASATMTNGVVAVTVPSGWTTPTTSNTTASTGSVAATGSTITVSGVTLAPGATLTVTYGAHAMAVTPAGVGGYDTFTVAMRPAAGEPLAAIAASPTVFVYALASPALLGEVTTVPLAVFNKIGITVPAGHPIFPPTILRKQPPFVTTVRGTPVPDSFFWGAEYCPYCAVTRWPVILALSRFGHFNRLYEMVSSPTDPAGPDVATFAFYRATYTSPYLAFTGYEVEDPFGHALMTTPAAIKRLVQRYNAAQSFPFMDVGNLLFVTQSAFGPWDLHGLSRTEIAGHLRDPSSTVTRQIVAFANYLTAGICASDRERPGAVCRSAGVVTADAALGLPRG
jgi:hypothetical protein